MIITDFNVLDLKMAPKRIRIGSTKGFRIYKSEPIYRRVGNRTKWDYVPKGSNINPFFPKQLVPAEKNIQGDENNNSDCSFKENSPKPFSVFAKRKSDEEDCDSEFIIDERELIIPEKQSMDALLQDYKNQNGISEMDELLLKIISDPALDYLGRVIVKRRLTADNILKFSERDWKRFGVMNQDDRVLIIKYLLQTRKN